MLTPVEVATKYLNVQESPHGSNRSPEIDAWLKAVGSPLGSPWCAAFVHACLMEAGVMPPVKSGRVQAWVDTVGADTLLPSEQAKAGDILVFWFPSLHRYAHIGLVTSRKGKTLRTIEGNTVGQSEHGNVREGYGVFAHTLTASPRLRVIRR